MYMKPSSTNGVAVRFSLPEVPPIATAKARRRFLTFDLLMRVSFEKRCAAKSPWFMSQFCGSGLRSRSNVTSAALSTDVPISTPAIAASAVVDPFLIVASLSFLLRRQDRPWRQVYCAGVDDHSGIAVLPPA